MLLTAPIEIQAALPDRNLTPGDIITTNRKEICISGYSTKVRHVTSGMKEYIYRRYGIYERDKAHWAIDHLIPLCAGGSNSHKNLWPMRKYDEWGKNKKDTLERIGCKKICSGKIEIKDFQRNISSDWIKSYRIYVK